MDSNVNTQEDKTMDHLNLNKHIRGQRAESSVALEVGGMRVPLCRVYVTPLFVALL